MEYIMFPKEFFFDKKCSSCGSAFVGKAANSLFCGDCKTNGLMKMCDHCGSEFRTKYNTTRYCKDCSDKKSFRIGVSNSDETNAKISEKHREWAKTEQGKNHYKKLGKHNSENLKRYFKTDDGINQITSSAKKQSVTIRQKIKSGEFTPNITNSWTRWTAVIDNGADTRKFRSSWEACFWLSNQEYEYETIRVESIKDSNRIYVGDFYDSKERILYEIKPKSEYQNKKDKMDSLLSYCKKNNIRFIWVNEFNIFSYIDETLFKTELQLAQLNKLKKGISNATQKNTDKKNRKTRRKG